MTKQLKVDEFVITITDPPYIKGLFFDYHEAKSEENEIKTKFLAQIIDNKQPEALVKFKKESEILLGMFDSPLFLKPIASYVKENSCIFIYEHCNGRSIEDLEEPIKDNEIQNFAYQMHKAISIVQNTGYMLRTLTPTSIFMKKETDGQITYKLADILPMQRVLENDAEKKEKKKDEKVVKFDPCRYIAPEATDVEDPKKITSAADVYSFGKIMKRLLTGKKGKIPKDANELLLHFISRCIDPNPEKRIPIQEIMLHPFMSQKGRYEKEFENPQFLGKGGFGSVYSAESVKDGKIYAVKRIEPQTRLDLDNFNTPICNKYVDMLHREISYMYYVQEGKVRNKNLASIVDHFLDGEYFYIVMEFYEGGNLSSLFKRPEYENGLPADMIFEYAKQIASGLKFLHSRSLVHRDLKPENIILTKKDLEDAEIKVMDFGISKIIPEKGDVMSFDILSILYIPQEVAYGEYDLSYDIFALAVIICEMIIGRHPAKTKAKMVNGKLVEDSKVNNEYLNKLRGEGIVAKFERKDLPNAKELHGFISCCIDPDRKKRPKIDDVIEFLEKLSP